MPHDTEVAGAGRPLRILYAITKANWGGAQRYVFDLAQAAKAAGHEVLVVSGAEGALTERLRGAGIETRAIASLGRDVKLVAEVRAFGSLLSIIREYRPDVIHGNSSKAGLLAGFAAHRLHRARLGIQRGPAEMAESRHRAPPLRNRAPLARDDSGLACDPRGRVLDALREEALRPHP
jgi:glycosyltransferase involved in cell wall biosynthesis